MRLSEVWRLIESLGLRFVVEDVQFLVHEMKLNQG